MNLIVKMKRDLLRNPSIEHTMGKWLRKDLPLEDVSFMDCIFRLNPRDNYTEFKLWRDHESPEARATKAIGELLRDTNARIVDVGANAGIVLMPILRAAGAGAKAIAFEPNPVMQDRFKVNMGLNNFENISLYTCAVSDANGRSPMYFPLAKNLGEGRIGFGYAKGNDTGSRMVEVRILPECLQEAGFERVDFLKVDVEGLEDRVIAPLLEGPETLWPRFLYFEVAHSSNWQYPLFDMLEQRGYELKTDYRLNHLYERRIAGESR